MSFLSRLLGASDTALSPDAFAAERDPDAPLLDVRTPAEFDQSHLAGARNADVMAPDFLERVEALNLGKDRPVYVYCRSGNRSGRAADLLRQRGYDAHNVGGIGALSRAGLQLA
jgi:rhodanese-related sulfurtransferase